MKLINNYRLKFLKYLFLSIILICNCISCKKNINNPIDLSYTQKDIPYQFGMAVPHFGHHRLIDVTARYDMGVRWVRRDIAWQEVERTRGVFNFDEADITINNEINNNVEVLGILNYSNLLYISDPSATTSFPPDTLDFFGNYVTQTVRHLKDRIHIWEIWNEPNGPTFWKPYANPIEYGKLVLVAAQRIRAEDPTAKIMLGGMVGNSDQIFFDERPWGFTEKLLEAYPEIVSWIDIYSIHPYTFLQNPSPEDASDGIKVGFSDMINNFKTILAKHGAQNKPIWATEYGWHNAIHASFFKGVTEEQQANYLVRASTLALSLGVELLFPYTYRDGPEDLTVSEAHFGMFRYADPISEVAYEPKPSYFAYKTMTQQLGNKSFTKDLRKMLQLNDKSFAFQFEDVIVAWSINENGDKINLSKIPQKITNTKGESFIPVSKEISINNSPVYIKF